ncbi:cyclic nucleotide-binding domain-containing protein [Desulfopila inferna]|uniref:cyclic nucleotide-binding domain-containing protein n=1 Tax=Desulfopila inferna TaxID=468528 RepID=UPI0019660FCD|nr:cyclic nucleotide-binding domain-containing protein [Desulfopila inferna]MBM9603081.1 cyclic nucleotide-binding domain-containing protein [Desulfopila inferna]
MKFRNAIFVVTEESHCPLYNAGDEFAVEGLSLTFPVGKSTCLVLAKDVIGVTTEEVSFEKMEKGTTKKNRFECGGCTGIIRFEYKKDKEFATLQMKLLAAAERKTKINVVSEFAGLLRSIDTFSSLSSDDLLDLAALLELKDYDYGFPIVQKGEPGTNLYIILKGSVEVIDAEGVALNEMEAGDVFGEMSLLTGERVSATIMATQPCRIATMNQKNFRHILQRFPALQVFFYKLMVRRITDINMKRAVELGSGMSGHIADMPPIDLCQMINYIQKSGTLTFEAEDCDGIIKFHEGEIIEAVCNSMSGKDAFFKILTMKKGRFIFVQGISARDAKKEIIGGFMAIMMEGMKYLDDLNK